MVDEQTFRAAIVKEARSWIGTNYHLGAGVKGAGVDCALLILRAYQHCGIVPPDEEAHRLSQDWWNHTTEEHYKLRVVRHCVKTVEAVTYKTMSGARPGDIVLLKTTGSKLANHGGIVLEKWPLIVHAIAPRVCVTDASKDFLWQFRTVEVYSPWEKYLEGNNTAA